MKTFHRVAALCLALVLAAAPALAGDFSGDVSQTLNGKPLLTGKAFVKDGKVRMESSIQGVTQVVISDPAKGRMVMLQPDMKMYMENRVDPAKMGPDPLSTKASEYGQWKTVGKETVNGMACEKRVFEFKDKSMGEMTGWFADGLDYPVKSEFKKGNDVMVVEYKNVKPGNLEASLFEVPAGYVRMNIPDMGQGGPAGMPGKQGKPGQ